MRTPLKTYGRFMKAPPADFDHLRDIEVFEGPLISEFRTDNGRVFLFIWRDRDDEYNRWLAIQVSERDIAMYEARQTTLHRLIQQARGMFLADADAEGSFVRWYALTREELPDTYLPQEASYFDPSLRPHSESLR